MKLIPNLALATSIILVAGCASKQETYTTDFLKTNDAKRAEVLADCQANKQSDINCKNANQAQAMINEAEALKKITAQQKAYNQAKYADSLVKIK